MASRTCTRHTLPQYRTPRSARLGRSSSAQGWRPLPAPSLAQPPQCSAFSEPDLTHGITHGIAYRRREAVPGSRRCIPADPDARFTLQPDASSPSSWQPQIRSQFRPQ
eukprot:3030196-Rhodomonas_salina.1